MQLLPLSIAFAGAAIHYFYPSVKPLSESNEAAPSADSYLVMIKTSLEYGKKAVVQLKDSMTLGIRTFNVLEISFSPKFVESSILLIGTVGMTWMKFKPSKKNQSLFSKVTTIGSSLLSESKMILIMHEMMKGLSHLVRSKKPPIKQLAIAGAMIVGSHIASRYSK
jgi:hypothetical protein